METHIPHIMYVHMYECSRIRMYVSIYVRTHSPAVSSVPSIL